MKCNVFKLEEYYAKYEFTTKYMLSSSDAESWSLPELLSLASPEERHAWDSQRFGYTETKGLPALREAIAQELYPGLPAEHILCFAGAEEGIFCSLLTLCTPKDHVIVLTPCYQSLKELPAALGSEITEIELREQDKWRININDIKQAIRPNTKVVIINFPHNPTGQAISPEELKELIAVLDEHNIWLFSDEVYRLLGSPQSGWADPVASVYKKGISLGVMSKSFGLPGLRIGWIACQDEQMLAQIARNRHYTTICNSGPSELLSVIALRNKDVLLKRNNDIVLSNLTLLDTFLRKHSDLFSWVRPEGGCTGFVAYHGKESIDSFCHRVAQEVETLLLPGSVYDVTTNHFRIGFGRKNMPEALNQFQKFIDHELR